MKKSLLRGLLAAALATAACTQEQAKQAAPNPNAGSVKLRLASVGRSASATAPAVCATFSLAPYSLAEGGAQTSAGSAVVVNATSSSVSPILGCVATPGVSPDWRYLVTASGFVNCATGAAIPGLSPSIETFTVDVTCTPGKDVSASVTAEVSIPVPNAGGYIDIGVGVNVDTPQSGCKDADIDSRDQLHFGQSYLQTTGGPTPSAYTGIGIFPQGTGTGFATPAGSLQQFAGSVNAGGNTDAFFTGLLQLPAGGKPVTLVQAFAKPCPGQMTIQPRAVECVTTAHGGGGKAVAGASTTAQIADVFVEWPGHGAVSATATGASLALLTSLGGPHLSSLAPTVLGHDDLTHSQALALSGNVLGVYGSLLHVGELFVLVQAGSGMQVVALVLDQTTGQWAASAPRPLTDFTSAQQQAMGLFGAGGCFPMPEGVLCAPEAAAPVKGPPGKGALTNHSGTGPTGTVSVVITHADGTPVDAAHPFVPGRYRGDGLTVNYQWEVSDIPAGSYAYATMGFCDPGIRITSTVGFSGGHSAPCVNGNLTPQGYSVAAFTPLLAVSGGVTQTFQFDIAAAASFYDLPTWTIPFKLYVSATGIPDVTTDTLVATTGTTAVALPYQRTYGVQTLVQIASVTKLAVGPEGAGPGWVLRLAYYPGYDSPYYASHYLEGTSQIELSPPTFTNGLKAFLVPNSAVGPIINTPSLHDAALAKNLNTNGIPVVETPDPVHGGIPHSSIDNLFYDHGPVYYADWFILEPTQQNTIMTEQAMVTWQGVDYTSAGPDGYGSAHAGTNLSPIPVNEIQNFDYHLCGDGFRNTGYRPQTKYSDEYNAGTYLADGTFVATPGALPTYPAKGDISACVYGYGSSPAGVAPSVAQYEFLVERAYEYPVAVNPVVVIKVPDDEHINSYYLVGNAVADLIHPSAVYTSVDPLCDNSNGTYTLEASPASGSFSDVRCVRYEFSGLLRGPVILRPFTTQLDSAITDAAPLGDKRFTTLFKWFTADNVLPDTVTGNVWSKSWLVNTWEKAAAIGAWEYYNSVNVPVATNVSGRTYAHVYLGSEPVLDYTISYKIAPGGQYLATDPDSWFIPGTQEDVDGVPVIWSCAIDPADHTVVSCYVHSSTPGVKLAPGTARLEPDWQYLTRYAYNGQLVLRQSWITSTSLQKADGTGPIVFGGGGHQDTILGPNSLLINKATHAGQTTANAGAAVSFDIDYGAQGADSGQLGAGGVEVFDFFGKDYLPGLNGAPGQLVAQSQGCVAPVPVAVSYLNNTGSTGSAPPAADLYYTTAAAPGVNLPAAAWLPVPPGGALPAGTTGIRVVPNSSQGDAGVLLPIDGTGHVQVQLKAPTGVTGKLCNSAVLGANAFQTTATPEAFVTLPPLCESNPWPQ